MKRRVRFEIEGDSIVGDLYLPRTSAPGRAVVVSGPMTSVKEQVTGVYAAAMAARGIAALAIDHRHYGESGGEPRHYEHHEHKVADLRASIGWLARQATTDPARIGLLGVCLGSGYAAHAAAGNERVRALACVAGYYRDPTAIRTRDPDDFDAKVAQGRNARLRFEETGHLEVIPAVSLTSDAAMTLEDTFDYYGTPRAGVPNYANAFAVMSREVFLPFDVRAIAPRVEQPTLMVHSENALSPAWARQFHESLPHTEPIAWLESRGQVDFYDDVGLVTQAADLAAAHFDAIL